MKKRLIGSTIFGIVLIVTSFLQLIQLFNFAWYVWLFSMLPKELLVMRYLFSLVLRVTGLICGLGVLLQKEFFRKAVLSFCYFTLLTLYFKHPFSVVKKVSEIAFRDFIFIPQSTISLSALVFVYAVDIIFCLTLIYYFSRLKVKAQFQ